MKKTSLEDLRQEHRPEVIRERLSGGGTSHHLPDAILGGIDGCITTFAVVSGAIGARFPASVALVLGFANLFADAFSMAVSNYEAVKAQQEHVEKVRRMEQEHIDRIPEGEKEELRQIFAQKGFSGDILEQLVSRISDDRHLWVETMVAEEHGLQRVFANPMKSAAATFGAFILAGAVPLLPFLVRGLTMQQQFIIATVLAGMVFFGIGMAKSIVYDKPILTSGLGTLATGGAAAALAYLTGYVLREVFGIA